MNEKISDRDLEYRYPDETEIAAWFQSLDESVQENYHYEYEAKVPDWYDFLRRKRFESLVNHSYK